MLIQEVCTEYEPAEVIRLAKEFFLTRFSPYGADIETEGADHVTFHLEAGEVVIGASEDGDRTLVRGSTSRLHHELSQFLTLLNSPGEVRQNLAGPGASGAG
jgi:hypothetical protein